MTTVTVSDSNTNVSEGSNLTLHVGNGMDTIAAGSNDTITIGNGPDTITIGSNDTITIGNGPDTLTAGSNDIIVIGDGLDRITAGPNATITAGNGPDSITAGPNGMITAGNGPDTVNSGANSVIHLGNGPDTVNAGTSNTITIGNGPDTIAYNGLTPTFTVPASLSVNEEHSIALPITLGPPALGHQLVTGFLSPIDKIALDTADFANFAAVTADATQVGPNTVITLDAGDTITLKGVALSSLSAGNFTFFNGTASDQITITGVPTDETLSAGTNNGGGSWTLTAAQLPGLQLNAGEPIGFPTPVQLNVAVTNPAGQMASASQNIALTVNPIPPTVGVTVLAPHSGDPVTETRLSITATADDFPADGASDFINRIALSGLPAGVTLSTGNTITPGSQQGTFTTEVDVFAPAAASENFNLGITAFADEPNSPEVSSSTSQNIAIDFSAQAQNLDFTTTGQSIWDTGAAFQKTFSTGFLGVNASTHGSTKIQTPLFGATIASAGGSIHFKAGFEASLHITAGDISADLPFQVGLDSTYNKTTDTLQIVPSEMQLGGGTFTEHGPGGSASFGLDLGLKFSAHGSIIGFGTSISPPTIGSFTHPVFSKTFKSSTVAVPIPLPGGLTLSLAFPTVNVNGSNSSPGPISNKGTSQDFVNLAGDLVAIASDIFFGTDVTDLSVGPFSIDLLDILIGAGLNLVQSFDVSASGLQPTLTLADNTTVPFSLSSPTTIPNISSHGVNPDGTVSFALSLTPNGDVTLHNQTSIGANLTAELQALGLSIGPIGFTVLDKKTSLQLGTFPPLFDKTFNLAGFNSQNVNATV